MPLDPTIEAFVSNQMFLFWTYISDNAIEAVVEDPQQVVDDLIEELRAMAMQSYLACKARETALSLYAGFAVDLRCVAPSE